MNPSRTQSSAIIYFDLPNFRRYQIATFEPRSGLSPESLADIRDRDSRWLGCRRAVGQAGAEISSTHVACEHLHTLKQEIERPVSSKRSSTMPIVSGPTTS